MAFLLDGVVGACKQVHQYLSGCPLQKPAETIVLNEMKFMLPPRWFVRVAGFSGALAVALAAYGAHAFHQEHVDQQLKKIFESANRMHLIHSCALLAVPLTNRPCLVGTLLTFGMVLFCGSCYYHALTNNPAMRFVTPYGGVLLIAGWLTMMM